MQLPKKHSITSNILITWMKIISEYHYNKFRPLLNSSWNFFYRKFNFTWSKYFLNFSKWYFSGASDFEEAISATKFGKFNLLLILIAIPSGWSSIFETTTMSYVFPAAQCDLGLSLDDKGLLNAVTYIGKLYLQMFSFLFCSFLIFVWIQQFS